MRSIGLGGVVVLLSCGSSSSSDAPVSDAGSDTVVDAATDADAMPTAGLKVRTSLRFGVGAPAVNVAAIRPDGTILAQTVTDELGLGTLADFSFGAQLVYLVSWKDGYGVEVEAYDQTVAARWRTDTGTGADAPFTVWCLPFAGASPQLSGVPAGVTAVNKLVVSSSVGVTSNDSPADHYAIRVRPGEKGNVVALEYLGGVTDRTLEQTLLQWVQLEHPAIAADTTFALDLTKGTKLAAKTAKLTLTLPGGATGALGVDTLGFAGTYWTGDAWVFSGATTKSAPSADGGSFAVDLQYVEPSFVGTPVTVATLVRPSDGARSERTLDGLPKDGDVIGDFEVPLTVASKKRTLADPIAFDGVSAGSDVVLFSQRSNGDILFRVVFAHELFKSIDKVPVLPADALALVPANMTGRFLVGRGWMQHAETFQSTSASGSFPLSK